MSTKKVILSILMLLCLALFFESTNRIDITVPDRMREAPAEKSTIRVVASPVETDYTGIPYMHKD